MPYKIHADRYHIKIVPYKFKAIKIYTVRRHKKVVHTVLGYDK